MSALIIDRYVWLNVLSKLVHMERLCIGPAHCRGPRIAPEPGQTLHRYPHHNPGQSVCSSVALHSLCIRADMDATEPERHACLVRGQGQDSAPVRIADLGPKRARHVYGCRTVLGPKDRILVS